MARQLTFKMNFLCRAKMEADLKTFVSKKLNVVGEKIELRVADIDHLIKDQTLTLKWWKLILSGRDFH